MKEFAGKALVRSGLAMFILAMAWLPAGRGQDKPGFLQLSVKQGKVTALAAAAFDPTKIEPTATMPSDFDSFWEAGKKELAAIPLDPQLEKSDKHSNEQATCYKITLANIGGKH